MNKLEIHADKVWSVSVLEDGEYVVKFGPDSDAIACPNRELYFKKSALNKAVIRHEVFHAFMYELPIHSADLSMNQTFEVVAEFLEEWFDAYANACEALFEILLDKEKVNEEWRIEVRSGESTFRSTTLGSIRGNSQSTRVWGEEI